MEARTRFGGRSVRGEEFDEEDVWGVVNEREDSSPALRKSKEIYSSSSSSSRTTAPRMIPKSASHENMPLKRSSAPMDIPDWSTIYGKDAKMGSFYAAKGDGFINGGAYEGSHGHVGEAEDNDDEEDDLVPPHEWIARKLARAQISSFSVCEGIGRTLKGRDLSKVRNAVLTKTGFLE